MAIKISSHFTLEEFTVSQTAVRNNIANIPNSEQVFNLQQLCEHILEPLRAMTGKSIRISSGYRCPELNARIGGAATSQHCFGMASDISMEGFSTEQLYQYIKHSGLPTSQCIQEFGSSPSGGWVHVSYDGTARHDFLRATKVDGRTVYTPDNG